jgi:hypothetical protein
MDRYDPDRDMSKAFVATVSSWLHAPARASAGQARHSPLLQHTRAASGLSSLRFLAGLALGIVGDSAIVVVELMFRL